MKLYYSKGACSLAARIIINELGYSCEYIAVDLRTKKTAGGENFKIINAKGSVPTLITDENVTITENAVILQYLADKQQFEPKLLASTGEVARYKVLEWLNYISSELHKGCAPLFNPNMPNDVKEQIIKPAIYQKLNFINEHLNNNKYLYANEFNLPDAYLFVILYWLQQIFKWDLSTWTNISTYYNRLLLYPSIKKSLEDEGMAIY